MTRKDVKHSASFVRDFNKKRIYDLIRRNEGISRAELTRMIDLTPTSVGKITGTLLEDGLIAECGMAADGKIGRNAIQLTIVPKKVLAIAIEADVGCIYGGVLDINRKVVSSCSVELPDKAAHEKISDLIASVINTLWDGLTPEQQSNVQGIGIACPGIIDHKKGFVRQAPQINWEDYPIAEMLRGRLHTDAPICVNNNVKAEAMAECIYGTADKRHSGLVVLLGSGFGTAFISAGRVQTGKHNAMGELGHILVGSNGIKCSCGRFGCLRTHIARTSIEERAGMDIRACVAAAEAGDQLCTDILEESVRYTAIWLANCVNLYDPEVIYLAGSMLEDWPAFYGRVVEDYRRYIYAPLGDYKYAIERSFVSLEKNRLIVPASIVFYQYLQSSVQIDRDGIG